MKLRWKVVVKKLICGEWVEMPKLLETFYELVDAQQWARSFIERNSIYCYFDEESGVFYGLNIRAKIVGF